MLLNAQSVQTISPFLYRKVPFDPVKVFDPGMVVGVAPYMLAVNPSVPAKNLRELVALAKASPGKFNYASAGNSTVNHLLGEMLKSAAGIDIVHVSYRGAAAAATDVVAGQVPIPGLYANAWYGLFVPVGTPKEIVTKLNTEIIKLMDNPEMRERLVGLGVESAPGTPEQLATLMRDDLVRWSKIVKDSGAQLD